MNSPGRFRSLGRSARRTWQLLGDPAALSLSVTLVYLPVTFIGPVFIDRQRLGGDLGPWLVVALAGQVALMVCFVLASSVLSRLPARSRPVATLASFAASATCRGLVLVAVASAYGFSAEGEVRYRIINGIFVHTAILVCLAILVVSREQHRRLIGLLRDRESSLVDLDATLQSRLTAMQGTLMTRVRHSLDRGLADLDAAVNGIAVKSDSAVVVNQLRSLLENQVRPLSASLASQVVAVDIRQQAIRSTPARVPLPERLSISQCLQPVAMTIVFTLGALSTAVLEFTIPRILTFAGVCSIFVFLVTSLARWMLRSWQPPLRIAVTMTGAITSVIGAFMPAVLEAISVPVPRFILLPSIIVGLVVGLATSGYAAVNARRASTEELLGETVDRLARQVSVLQQGEWLIRRRLSYLVHGALQAAIQAGIIKLSEGQRPSDEVLHAVRQDIGEAVSAIEQVGRPGTDPESILKDLAVVWDGVCIVTWEVEPAARALFTEQPMCAESAAEVIRECIGNAIWHGQSSRVVATISCRASARGSRLLLQVLDNGIGCPPDAVEGMGSRLMDVLCLTWNRRTESGGTMVTAEIAFPDPPSDSVARML